MEKPTGSLISFMANKVKSKGGINLAQGIPSFDPPMELLELLKRLVNENVHQYAPGKGNHELLCQLGKYYNVSADNFLVVNGATEAISLIVTYLLKIENEPFAFLAFNPVYESYKHLPRIFNKKFVSFHLNETGYVNFTALEKTIVDESVKLIFMASPGNPFGKIWNKTELDSLIDICIKNQVFLIIDAVYADLYFSEPPYLPFHKFNEYVFYVNAFSKRFSITGWRVGYLWAHTKHMAALMDVHDYIGLCAPSILQQAIASYVDRYDFGRDYMQNIRENLKANYKQLAKALTDLGFDVKEAQGGYFIWAKLPEQFNDGFEFAMNLYNEKKVALVPGEHFSDNGGRFIRINIARHSYEISMAIEKIKEFINKS